MEKKPGPANINLALIIAIIAVSFSAIFIRWVDQAAPLAIAAYRLGFTTLIILPFALHQKEELFNIERRDFLIMVAIGVVLAAHFAFWITSIEETSVASSVILVTSHPLFVGLVAHYYFKEKLSLTNAIGIITAFSGIIILSAGDWGLGGTNFRGDMFALVGAFAAGTYILGGRQIRKGYSLFTYCFVVYGVCTITLFTTCLFLSVELTAFPGNDWILFILMALIPGILGHTVYNWTLGYVNASVVSVSLLGEPIGSSILAVILLSELPTEYTIIGGAIVLIGIYLTYRKGIT
jgi:drug/metabolite transporter (DMT)-like permease